MWKRIGPGGGRGAQRLVRWLSAVAGAAVLVACGGSGSAGGQGAPTTLTLWTYWSSQQQAATLRQVADIFKKSHPNVTIQQVTIPVNAYTSKLLAAAGTHTGPDLVMDNPVVDFTALSKAGVFVDLSKDWSSFAGHNQVPDTATWKANGKIEVIQPIEGVLGLYYNKDILDKFNLQPPRTLDELERDLATVTSGHQYQGLSLSVDPGVDAVFQGMSFFLSNGVNFCNFKSPATQTTFELLSSWVAKGYIPREADSWSQPVAGSKFAGGNFAFALNGNFSFNSIRSAAKFSFGVVPFPAGSAGSVTLPAGAGVGVGAFSKNKSLAWEYLRDGMFAKEAQVALYKGVGFVPTRKDVSAEPPISSDPNAKAFVYAVAHEGRWPDNPNSAKIENDVSEIINSVVAGSLSADQATSKIRSEVSSDIASGGGKC